MFESFFGFKKTPFSDCPDGKQVFASEGWRQVQTRLEFLTRHPGAGLLTGEVGAGKSTAARVFTRSPWPWTSNRRTSAATWCGRSPQPSCT